jgi:hypothetical protein
MEEDMDPTPKAFLEIKVLGIDGRPLSAARVEVSSSDAGKDTSLAFREGIQAYVGESGPPGTVEITVSHRGLETQVHEMEARPGTNRKTVVLGKKGTPYFHRGPVKVPFEPRSDLLGVKLRDPDDTRGRRDVLRIAGELKLEEYDEIPEAAEADGFILLRGDPSALPEAMIRFEGLKAVAHAGAVLLIRDRSVSLLTNEFIVKLRDGVPDQEGRSAVASEGLEILRAIPYIPGAYHVRRAGPATYDVLEAANRLGEHPNVEWAEPNLVTSVELDQVVPSDFLWPGVWDRQLIGTPEAWGLLEECGGDPFGSPEVIIAFVDQGIESSGGVPQHPEFQGAVSDGSSKTYRLYDFRNLVPNNDAVLGDHGMGVAGVGAARANNSSIIAGQDEGLAGAAPNCRVMGLIFPFSESDRLDMYVWAAGFDPGSPRPGFPAPIDPGADIFSTSIGFGAGAPISGQAAATFDFLVANGRGGRGCLCFFSAGNAGNEFTTYRPWAAYENTFGMAASSIDDDGSTEIRAPYSGFGPVELCAPSHDEYVAGTTLHNPPANYATWSTALVGSGNLVGHPGVETILINPAAAGAVQLTVADAVNFLNGARVLVGAPGTPGSEPAAITGPPNVAAGTIPVSALMNPHAAGVAVVSGMNDYRNNFGGTSSATPLAAGAAGLLLSADPDLTFVEARQILRDTAEKIDPDNVHPVGQWMDAANNPSVVSGNPPVFSQWYGHGRVDIAAAIRKVVTMKPKKPEAPVRRRRKYVVKFVCGKADGEILSVGKYYTAVNVHNPGARRAVLGKTISTALPGERTGHVVDAGRAVLGPSESFEIDCADLQDYLKIQGCCFTKGFLVLESASPLEVVAVYSASGADGEVESIHTERVPAMLMEEPEDEEPPEIPRKLPDLLPIPPFPSQPGPLPYLFCRSRRELAVVVRNQGEGDAPQSVLRVEFIQCGQVVDVPTPPIPAGTDSPVLTVMIPPGCWSGEILTFRITANATMAFQESDGTNNSVQSSCSILT